jgi:sugar phosphate isomerase/epimerase
VIYSVSSWIFGRRPIETVLQRLAALGYDAVELKGEPDDYELSRLCPRLADSGLAVSSICGMYPGPSEFRDLSHPDRAERERAVDYVRSCVDLAVGVQAPLVIVTPNPVGKTKPRAPRQSELQWAAEAVHTAGEYAGRCGVSLAIEPINRYETYLLNSAEQALRFVRDVGLPSVKMMLDTFHMNIEDPEPGETVRKCAGELIHLHLADSNRQSVGRGHFDFRRLMQELYQIGYDGALAMEPLPPVPDPYQAMQEGFDEAVLDSYLGECAARLRALAAKALEKGC